MVRSETLNAMERAIARLPGVRALVVGDVILDRYLVGDVARISPEAPVPVLRQTSCRTALGGAANVALHFTAFGGQAVLVGLTGTDTAAGELAALAVESGIDPALVRDPTRATTVKSRVVAQNQQMLRIDEETVAPAREPARSELLRHVDMHVADCDVVIVSDYAKGALAEGLAADVIACARAAGKQAFADPKSADFNAYRGASLICPNVRELEAAVHVRAVDDASAAHACRLALDAFEIDAILLTRSEQGMTLLERGGEPLHVRAQALQVFDVSGAGDTSIATVAAGMAAGLSLPDAVRLGNAAAGVVVGKAGTATLSVLELKRAAGLDPLHRPVTRDEAAEVVRGWRAEGRTVGFTNGVFDLIHSGHLESLEQAARHCDMLVVGVNADASVKRLKGPSRPVQDQFTRARLLASLDFCDLVVIFDEDTPIALIEALQPDVLFKGADYREDQVVGGDIVKARGGRVVLLPLIAGVSTTATLARIADSVAREP